MPKKRTAKFYGQEAGWGITDLPPMTRVGKSSGPFKIHGPLSGGVKTIVHQDLRAGLKFKVALERFKRAFPNDPGLGFYSPAGGMTSDIAGHGYAPIEYGPWWDAGATPGYGRPSKVADYANQLDWMHGLAKSQNWEAFSPAEPLTRDGVERLGAWKRTHFLDRGQLFYGNIDPVSFSQEYTSKKLGVGRRGTKWWKVLGRTEEESDLDEVAIQEAFDIDDVGKDAITLEDEALDYTASIEEKQGRERLSGDPDLVAAGANENVLDLRKDPVRLSKKTRFSHESVSIAAAQAEYRMNVHYRGLWKNDKYFLNKPTQGTAAIFSDAVSMAEHYSEIFGQKKTLRLLGRVNEYGRRAAHFGDLEWTGMVLSRRATRSGAIGSYTGKLNIVDLAESVLKAKGQTKFLKAARELSWEIAPRRYGHESQDFFRSKEMDDFEDQYSQSVRDLINEYTDSKSKKEMRLAKKKIKQFATKVKDISESGGVVSSGIERINVKGYRNIIEEIQASEVGRRYMTEAGEWAEVVDVGGPRDIMVKTALGSKWKGKVVPMSWLEGGYSREVSERVHFRDVRRTFELAAVKSPGKYGGKWDPHAVQMFWGTGEFAGVLGGEEAAEWSKGLDIKEGYLGVFSAEFDNSTGELSANIFEEGVKSTVNDTSGMHRKIGYLKNVGKEGKLYYSDLLGKPLQENLRRAFEGDTDLLRIPESIRKLMQAGRPLIEDKRIFDFVPVVESIKKASKSMGLWVGLTIASGALLMWGASKMRGNVPITEKDVPRSMYGNVDIGSGPAAQQYVPSARIVQGNTGYSTNIDVETTDSNGVADYRAMAGNLGSISKSALGVRRASTSLHVIDDSERMDRESTRRKMNQYLGT